MIRDLSPRGRQTIEELARRYGCGREAVTAMMDSLVAGGGTMAQFDHPEFGGMGQWTRGGMTMVGDMFDHALKAKVDGLCRDLSRLLADDPLFSRPVSTQRQSQSRGGGGGAPDPSLFVSAAGPAGAWWPAELGSPAATGSQNDLRYAYFPAARRLAVEADGRVTVYDTLDHEIGGVWQQQQSAGASLTFVGQRGPVRLADLPVVSQPGRDARASSASAPGAPSAEPSSEAGHRETAATAAVPSPAPPGSSDDVFAKIERLADLRAKGILSEEEFAAKKAELLSRL